MDSKFISPDDAFWRITLNDAPHDVYHLPEYVEFASRYEGGQPTAFYAQTNGTTLLIPLLLRELPSSLQAPSSLRDAFTPYGYPSPLIYPTADSDTIRQLLQAFQDTAKDNQIVTAFLRLHPLLPSPLDILGEYGGVVHHGQTVYIDLSHSNETAWKYLRHGHQSDIQKLLETGFSVVVDDWMLLDDFIKLYRDTMKRLSAKSFYIFPDNYFEDLRHNLKECVHLCAVLAPNGEIACAGLFFTVGELVQYHLSGAAASYAKQAPTKLMLDHMRRWSKEQGYKMFHLGGGVGAANDSLFNFKSGFSKLRAEFHTYRMILDQERYNELLDLWKTQCGEAYPSSDYFPLYRYNCESG